MISCQVMSPQNNHSLSLSLSVLVPSDFRPQLHHWPEVGSSIIPPSLVFCWFHCLYDFLTFIPRRERENFVIFFSFHVPENTNWTFLLLLLLLLRSPRRRFIVCSPSNVRSHFDWPLGENWRWWNSLVESPNLEDRKWEKYEMKVSTGIELEHCTKWQHNTAQNCLLLCTSSLG